MIRLEREHLLSLAEAAAEVRSARGPNISDRTVRRWMVTGVRGVRLENVWLGGAKFTSREALARFLRRLNETQPEVCEAN